MSKINSGAGGPDTLGCIFLIVLTVFLYRCVSSVDSENSSSDVQKQEWIDSEMKKADEFCARNPDFESCW